MEYSFKFYTYKNSLVGAKILKRLLNMFSNNTNQGNEHRNCTEFTFYAEDWANALENFTAIIEASFDRDFKANYSFVINSERASFATLGFTHVAIITSALGEYNAGVYCKIHELKFNKEKNPQPGNQARKVIKNVQPKLPLKESPTDVANRILKEEPGKNQFDGILSKNKNPYQKMRDASEMKKRKNLF